MTATWRSTSLASVRKAGLRPTPCNLYVFSYCRYDLISRRNSQCTGISTALHYSECAHRSQMLGRAQYFLCGAGVVTALGAMSAPAWEIKNSASLAFTALLMRTVGFKNVTKVRHVTHNNDCDSFYCAIR